MVHNPFDNLKVKDVQNSSISEDSIVVHPSFYMVSGFLDNTFYSMNRKRISIRGGDNYLNMG